MLIKKIESITLEQIPKINPYLKQYFILTTNEKKDLTEAFDTNAIAGQLVAFQLKKQLKNTFKEKDFITEVLLHFQNKINEDEYASIIKEIYFTKDTIPLLTPLMYMAKPLKSLDTKTKKSLEIFKQMIQNHDMNFNFESNLNFIEQDIFLLFNKYIENTINNNQTNSYVTFLDDIFTQDFSYLLNNQHSFQTQIDRFLKFYFFIYSAQLALNIHTNPLEKPFSQKLYFILNHEKASSERKNLMNYGYKTLISKVRYMFPYLSLLETLSDLINEKNLKLYHFKEIENNKENIKIIDDFTQLYKNAKEIPTHTLFESTSTHEALLTLLNATVEQFKADNKTAAIGRFIAAFEKQISSPFFQSRGRSGKVLVLDQDTILLLTNLAIGDKKQLRFQELMDEFRNRSVYFDPKSEDALLELYERVGNVDRKSDSGDAVYVKAI